jgi:hypothetical protein
MRRAVVARNGDGREVAAALELFAKVASPVSADGSTVIFKIDVGSAKRIGRPPKSRSLGSDPSTSGDRQELQERGESLVTGR